MPYDGTPKPVDSGKTPDYVLRSISRNIRSVAVKDSVVPSAAKTIAVKTPGKRSLAQVSPTSAASTVKRHRATPRRGWIQPTTPHGARALESRRAGLTPGKPRRQSGKLRRETPRDILRALSRVLPRPDQPEKEVLEPTLEVDEEANEDGNKRFSSDESSEEPPRLSFGVGSDEQDYDVEKSRRVSDRLGLSMADSSMLAAGLDESDNLDEDEEEKPVTRLLGDSFSSEDLEPPDEPTFGNLDQQGDTMALRELIALTRSPETPNHFQDPSTPTADLSFALDIPDLPQQSQSATPARSDFFDEGGVVVEEEEGFDDDIGGFEIQVPDGDVPTDEIQLNSQSPVDVAPFGVALADPLEVQLAQTDPLRKKTNRKAGGSRAPHREGLSKGVVKRVATSFISSSGIKKGRLKRGAVDALVQATDWFFEQASEDLAAYSEHAGRKKIDESDFLLLARRQRLLTPKSTLFSLANKFLPRELLRDVRIARLAPKEKGTRSRRAKSQLADVVGDAGQAAEDEGDVDVDDDDGDDDE